jgi:hypothetical protein
MSRLFAFLDSKAGANLILLPSACVLAFGFTTATPSLGNRIQNGLVNFMSALLN